ncbi:MAG: hypothetical protein IJ415_00220, partial [Clostridia bacterium]|nr:hypothetical protein [Clostridia bacterium]
SGIIFNSFLCHRIKIDNFKTIQLGTKVYIKTNSKLVTISNVDKVFKHENYLYFTALGKVKILFNCDEIYKYFNIEITSKKFSIEELKQEAIYDLINNNFEINFCKILKRYIKIIENVLNIHIFQEKLVIKQNKFQFPFELKYKLNNRIKHISINETLEEN